MKEELKNIDWEQRRYEIAKEILAITCNFTDVYGYHITTREAVSQAVSCADALIAALKKRKED